MISQNTKPPEDSSLDLVVFKAGSFLFGVETSRIRSSCSIPGYVIPEIESLLSISGSTTNSHRQCLVIKGDKQDYEISVATPLDLLTLREDRIHPLPAAIMARCKLPGLRALAMMEGELILLIEPHKVSG